MKISKLGVLAQLDHVSFANLSSKDLVIAKMGDGETDDQFMTPLGESDDPFHVGGLEDTVHLNLQAVREIPRSLAPMEDLGHEADGNFRGGTVRLEVQEGVNAIVTENHIGGTDSDYQRLNLFGQGHVSIGNNINGDEGSEPDFVERLAEGESGGRLDNAVVDASKLTGGLYFQNDPDIIEKMIFSEQSNVVITTTSISALKGPSGEDSTNLVGSTYGHMDVVSRMGEGDYIDIDGSYFTPEGNDYELSLPDTAAEYQSFSGKLQQQFAAADAYSADNDTVVWFVGRDHNTYVWDDNGTEGVTSDDFAIKIIGDQPLVNVDGHIGVFLLEV